MKLIITGGTGFVATELIRQSLLRKDITTLVVLSRGEVSLPKDVDASKLKRVAVTDYAEYSDDVKKELAGANGCIWTVAILPHNASSKNWDQVIHVNQESPLKGLQAMRDAGPAKPFRFLYMSGAGAPRDPNQFAILGAYGKMRGETENKLIASAKDAPNEVHNSAAKPGLITSRSTALGSAASFVLGALGQPYAIKIEDLSRAMIQQTLYGFESDALENGDLKRLAKGVDKQ